MKLKSNIFKVLLVITSMLATSVMASTDSKDTLLSEWDQRRITAWHELMQVNKSESELSKLSRVNSFLNQIQYAEDANEWGIKDYWATPAEFISRNAGDCEDFAIAKYFTLIKMGVPAQKLRIAYVYSKKLKQAHMVLYYYPESSQPALVLDNLTQEIKSASQRKDLMPVYSFNKDGLWLVNKNGSNHFVGSVKRLSRWTEMLKRLPQDSFAKS